MKTAPVTGLPALYRDGVARGEYRHDPAQETVLGLLQDLSEELAARPPSEPGLLARLLGRWPASPPVQGLYCWGGVGRGKTFLMDLFHDALPFRQKKRLHFHRFMREVHQGLIRLQGQPNPLREVAAGFARQARVICFDEFFVSDITDAMLLAGLLEELFRRGVTLVATSNVAPHRLYENGLQRRKFLPAIKLLETHTRVHHMDGGVDYRLRALESAGVYHYPLDESSEARLEAAFRSLSPDAGRAGVVLSIEGRDIPTRRCGDGVVWFDFAAVCDGPRSQNDYIELARLFQTVLIGMVPTFTEKTESQARRFISLVDEFYDRNVRLILSAAAAIPELYQGRRLAFEFQRTMSRLQEMQSVAYLGRAHRP